MIKKETDCYYGFVCPYNAKSHEECEQWCGVDDELASEDEELCDGCQFGGECENCEEYYWYT